MCALIQVPLYFISRCKYAVIFADFKGTLSPFVKPLIFSNATVKLERLVSEFTAAKRTDQTIPTENEKFVSGIDSYTCENEGPRIAFDGKIKKRKRKGERRRRKKKATNRGRECKNSFPSSRGGAR